MPRDCERYFRSSHGAWKSRAILVGLLLGFFVSQAMAQSSVSVVSDATMDRPNIVFIAIDDLNDWIGCLGGNPDVKTPNLDRLAARGLLFRNAHCQVPVCMGSRVSVFSGRLPSSTGCYEFNADFHEASSLVECEPIPMYFRHHGYTTLGGGKLLHSGFQGRLTSAIEVSLTKGNNPAPKVAMHWPVKVWDYGAYPDQDEAMGDFQLAKEAAGYLSNKQPKPFFLAAGFHRPHVPLYVPKKWFDLYDRERLTLPKAPLEDLADVPESDITRQKAVAPSHRQVLEANQWRNFVHAYLACISFVDHCVGMVVDAALEGPNAENTIVVLWSDHGFHLGEKQHWAKRTLWEESTRTPLMFAGKGIPKNVVCDAAVGLIDIYPTLVELAQLPELRSPCDGVSLMPFIRNPAMPSDRFVLSTWLRGITVLFKINGDTSATRKGRKNFTILSRTRTSSPISPTEQSML